MTIARPVAPPAVRWIVRTLEEAGHETWAVGGAVRDVLLGIPSGDWDLATRARPEEVRATFRRTVPIGIEHGTVGVLARDGTMYEVTTFRRDVETDGRHAVVAFAEHIEDDLGRRDFTINAVAWHPLRDEFLDPYGGLRDLEQGLLRAVGDPEERFKEDYLRILRALRFAGRFRLRVDGRTWLAACLLVDRVRVLSAERVRDELLKILGSDVAPSVALELYADAGALAVLYPELEELRAGSGGGDRSAEAWGSALAAVDALPKGRPLLRLAALMRELGAAEAAAVLLRLRLSNAQVEEIARRAGAEPLPDPDASDADFRRWLSATGAERLSAVARLDLARARAGRGLDPAAVVAAWRRAKSARASGAPLEVGDLAIDGRDLIALGLKPGPLFGRVLEQLLAWVLEEPARNRSEVLREQAVALWGKSDG